MSALFEPVLGVETPALIKRAFIFLEDSDFNEAERYFEQALNQDPENSQAYLGKLIAEMKVRNIEELSEIEKPLQEQKLFQRAIQFANEEEKLRLEKCLQNQKVKIQEKLRLAELEKKFNEAMIEKSIYDGTNQFFDLRRIADLFDVLGDYKDSKTIAADIRRQADELEERIKIRSARKKKFFTLLVLIAIVCVAVLYGVKRYNEYDTAKRIQEAEQAREQAQIEATQQALIEQGLIKN